MVQVNVQIKCMLTPKFKGPLDNMFLSCWEGPDAAAYSLPLKKYFYRFRISRLLEILLNLAVLYFCMIYFLSFRMHVS